MVFYLKRDKIEFMKNNEEIKETEVVEQEPKKDGYVMPLPEEEKKKNAPIELEPNSKPFWTMRLAGGLIDICLAFLAAIGFYALILITPMSEPLNFNKTQARIIQDNYKVTELVEGSDETYGHKVYEDDPEYGKYTTYVVHEEEDGTKYVVVNNDTISDEVIAAYKKALKEDKIYQSYVFNAEFIDYGYTMLASFVSSAIFYIVIPLVNKRRATVGMLLAGTQLIHSKYYVRSRWYQVVGRYIFQFLVLLAGPYLFLGGWAIFIMPLASFITTLFTKSGRSLHDVISFTKVIDKRTFKKLSEM